MSGKAQGKTIKPLTRCARRIDTRTTPPERTSPPIPKGNGRESQKQARRNAILEVATPFFLEHGFDATCMSEIAAALGGSKGTLWTYFPSKIDLFAGVISYCSQRYQEDLGLTLKEGADLPATIRHICESLIEKSSSRTARQLMQLWLHEGERFPTIRTMMYDGFAASTLKLLTTYFENEINAGRLRKDDPRRMAQTFILLSHHGYYSHIFFEDSYHPPQNSADYYTDLFLRAFSI